MSKRRRAGTPAMPAVKRPASEARPPAAALDAPPGREEFWCLVLLVTVPVLFNAVLLWPELTTKVPNRNDLPLHWQMIKGASQALGHWSNPIDFWIPQMELGFPQFLYYQNLPHLFVALVHRLLFGAVDLLTVFNATRYVLLVGFPLTVYWSLRRLEFSVRSAAIGAALSSLFANRDGYGLEFNGDVWLGRGLYTQLWGVHLSFISMACLYRVIRSGTGYVSALLALTALALSHFLLAYMIAITGIIMVLATSDRRSLLANSARLAIAGGLAALVASYMLVPFAESSGRFLAVPPGIRTADFDPITPFASALNGNLMDAGRLPVLTLLAGVGIVAALMRRNRTALLALVGTGLWLILYQFRPTEVTFIGRVLRYDGHLIFRFVAALEMFALMLMALGGEWIWNGVRRLATRMGSAQTSTAESGPTGRITSRALIGPVLSLVVLLAVMLPAFVERSEFYGLNARTMQRTDRALTANTDLKAVLDRIATETKAQSGGRAYVGLASNWGETMWVGPVIKAYDVLKFSDLLAVAPPYQALSLNADAIWRFKDAVPARYDLLDLRYVIAPAKGTPPPFFQPLFANNLYALYRVSTSGIAEYGTVTERRAVASQAELLQGIQQWLDSSKPDTHEFIRWDYMAPAGAPADARRCPDGHTISERSEANRLHVVVACQGAGTLVFKTTFHPNWHVAVDGKDTPTYMVSPSFLAIDLPAGEHAVDAEYRMATSKLVLLLFGMTVLVMAIAMRDRLDLLPRRLL